jgi:hypothetical protein
MYLASYTMICFKLIYDHCASKHWNTQILLIRLDVAFMV